MFIGKTKGEESYSSRQKYLSILEMRYLLVMDSADSAYDIIIKIAFLQ